MRKIFFLISIICLLAHNSSYGQKGFHFGVKFQPSLSSVKNSNWKDSTNLDLKSTLALGAGVIVAFNIFDFFGVQGEILYSEQGQKYSVTESNNNTTDNFLKINYVNVPLLVHFNTSSEKSISVNITGGIQLGVLLNAELVSSSSSGSKSITAVTDIKPIEVGTTYGAGVDFNLTENLHLNLGLRFVYGIVDINHVSKAEKDLPDYASSYNSTASIYAGITF